MAAARPSAPSAPAPDLRSARTEGDAALGDDAAALLGIVLALTSIGIVMVWSTSAIEWDRAGDPTHYLRKQVLWTVLAGIGLSLAWTTDYRTVLRYRTPIVAAVAAALVAVLFQTDTKGGHRWFDLGGFKAQPSEPAKVAAIVWLAAHCADRERLRTLRGAVEGFGVLGLLVGLVLVEPDLGTAALIGVVGGLMLLVAGVRLAHAALFSLPAAGIVALYATLRFEHVKARISVFLDPEADPEGKGYQIRQALIALGSGGPTGLGLGDSKQKLFFLPDDHTDFILAILGEEMGLAGTLAVVALFAALVVYGVKIALRAADREGFLVAVGITCWLGFQAAMNIAVVTASMPTKGISLPFVSYGGSSLIFAMAAVGMLLSVASGPSPHAAPSRDLRSGRMAGAGALAEEAVGA